MNECSSLEAVFCLCLPVFATVLTDIQVPQKRKQAILRKGVDMDSTSREE